MTNLVPRIPPDRVLVSISHSINDADTEHGTICISRTIQEHHGKLLSVSTHSTFLPTNGGVVLECSFPLSVARTAYCWCTMSLIRLLSRTSTPGLRTSLATMAMVRLGKPSVLHFHLLTMRLHCRLLIFEPCEQAQYHTRW